MCNAQRVIHLIILTLEAELVGRVGRLHGHIREDQQRAVGGHAEAAAAGNAHGPVADVEHQHLDEVRVVVQLLREGLVVLVEEGLVVADVGAGRVGGLGALAQGFLLHVGQAVVEDALAGAGLVGVD